MTRKEAMETFRHDSSLVDYARKEIQSRIQNGVYLPGSRLSAQEIAASLGISRTPVSTAINQLIAQGFAERVSSRQCVVTQLSLVQVRETIQVREMIELYTADLIAKNMIFCKDTVRRLEDILDQMYKQKDEDYELSGDLETQFHTEFISLCRNSRIIQTYDSNWSIGIVFLLFARSQMPLYKMKQSIDQHREMLEYAKSGDVEGIRSVVRKHLEIVNSTLTWLIENDTSAIFTPFASGALGERQT